MRRSLLAWSLVAGLAGCRSAGGPPVRPSTEPPPDFVQSFFGQRRILMHAKGETRVELPRGAGSGGAPGVRGGGQTAWRRGTRPMR